MKSYFSLIVLVLFIPTFLFGQMTFKLKNKKEVEINKPVIDLLIKNIDKIKSIEGKTVYRIPYLQQIKKNSETIYIDGEFYQIANGANDFNIDSQKLKYVEIDFSKNKITYEKNWINKFDSSKKDKIKKYRDKRGKK